VESPDVADIKPEAVVPGSEVIVTVIVIESTAVLEFKVGYTVMYP
jgi:hypothetical protein